jgi:tetratricopeptide (TPR) repeat protein
LEALMKKRSPFLVLICLLLITTYTFAQHEHHAPQGKPPETLGEVNFAVTCSEAAQKEFKRSMALFHSFWFDPAKKSFAKVLELDPECGMAHWGIAFMSLGNPFTWPAPPQAMQAGSAEIKKAQQIGAKSQREKDYINALAGYFQSENTEHPARMSALVQAMKGVAKRNPEDDEAQILYAILLTVTAPTTDKTFANQIEAAKILEPLFKKYPNHPGVAHYLIHTYDYADLAEKGLPAARAYSKIAPSVPHALHMPTHIFTRVGLWDEMVEGNLASYRAANAELKESTLGVGTYDALHAMDYMVFGLLQQSKDKAAKKYVDEVSVIQKVNVENFAAAYAFAAIPSRYALERGNWKEAAALQLSPKELAWEKFPQAEAILVFSRALGSARSGDVTAAEKDVQRLQELKATMNPYWAGQTDIQIHAVNAWIAFAQKENEKALTLMRKAAELEEASDKHPVTPGNVVPSRELVGEMLLAMNQSAEALVEFQHSLKRDPKRLRAVYGAAKAAEASGNRKVAEEYYKQLQTLTKDRDSDRPELAHISRVG